MAFARESLTPEEIAAFEGRSEFMKVTGLHFEEVSKDRVRGWIDLGPQHHQPMGIVHGGVYAAAIEGAASFGASFGAPPGHNVVGVHNSTHFVRAMAGGSSWRERLSNRAARSSCGTSVSRPKRTGHS